MPDPLDLPPLVRDVLKVQTDHIAQLEAENEALRAESVPRSALVQVGWWDGHFIRLTPKPGEPAYYQGVGTQPGPVYVIREDTDA